MAQAAPNFSGANRTPAMTGEAVRTTGPVTSTDRKRAVSSSSRIRPSSRARTAPMQKWGPNPNAT